MKKYIYLIFLYTLIFSAVNGLFNGIVISRDPAYWAIVMLGFSVVVILGKPLLKFLTIQRNFITVWFLSAVMVFGAIYAFDLFLPSFFVKQSVFLGVESDIISVASFKINPVMTMLSYAFVATGVCALMDNLNRGSSDE